MTTTDKLVAVCRPGQDSFLKPVVSGMNGVVEGTILVTNDLDVARRACSAADIVWLEWIDDLAVALTQTPGLLHEKRVICRLHSYEAFTPWPAQMNWEVVDDLVFVGPHVRDFMIGPDAGEQSRPRVHVIPNGVDLEEIPTRGAASEATWRLAYVGYLNFKKAPLLLMQAFQTLAAVDERWTLHIAGTHQEPRYALYFEHILELWGLQERVFEYGWVDDIPSWLGDKDAILCTSVFESQGMGVMEAMAAGVRPLVHHFPGAERIYPRECLWSSLPELVELVGRDEPEPGFYRRFVEARYALEDTTAALCELITGPRSATQGGRT